MAESQHEGTQARRDKRSVARYRWSFAAALLSWAIGCGCSEETATPSTGGASDTAGSADTKGDVAKDAKADTGGSGGDSSSGPDAVVADPTEKFWITYNHRYRIPGDPKATDLMLTNWKNPDAAGNPGAFGAGVDPRDPTKPAIELTKIAFKLGGGLSCTYGCYFSRDLKWMMVAKGNADATGHYTYLLGSVNDQLSVFVDPAKLGELKDVKHLAFANNYLFYSQKANCLGTGACQYDIHRRGPLGEASIEDVVLTRMAPDNDPDVEENDTAYNGFFRVSDDASTLLFLTPTIRSQRVWVWRNGNLSQLDYICPNWDGVKCVGTGSQYHDNDPAALSMDGKQAVMFSIVSRWLRARHYEVGTENPTTFSNMVEVPEGQNYLQNACAALSGDQHVEVKFDPQFSADGKTVWFVGYSKCGAATDKAWSDVMSLNVARIGQQLGPGDWVNWTKHPRTNTAKNKVIQGFAISPERKVFVLSATASISSQGAVLADGDQRHRADTELYTMPVGGSTMTPITNENAWHAELPATVLPISGP
jgi:hypothetical protein